MRKYKGKYSRESGAQAVEVGEHPGAGRAVVVFEFEAYPEPKALTPAELRALHVRHGSFYRVAEAIGASEAFARQKIKKGPRRLYGIAVPDKSPC